ncbi:unnamed protein product [Ilex paraguariensis]|uniref:F-box protein n=1 Tax=Ilex paraguariensis TaxID=185542 RepID=A0ABC8SAA7_9AQUA
MVFITGGLNLYISKLVSFDMGKEEFKEFQGPPDLHQDSDCEIRTLYNGSIALIYSHSRVPLDAWESAEQSSLAVWVLMEEEGCWIKQLSIGLHGMMIPAGLWKNDELFLETTTGHLVLYDPNTQLILKDLQILAHSSRCLDVHIYTESLVSVHRKGDPGEHKNPSGTD